MDVVTSVQAMQQRALGVKRSGRTLGLVPTMGYLHEGHLSLVALARKRVEVVILSIFVNPIQFLPGEDLASYPRDFERDRELCCQAGVDLVFFPAPSEMYAADHSVCVEEASLSMGLCGASRPGHFRGVTTVVAKLFNITRPDVAVFGQKDAQQCRVIQRMVRDLNIPVEVVVGPILREPDGLAMSSRNKYLSPGERQQALCLRRSLEAAEALVRAGERAVPTLQAAVLAILHGVPGLVIDYVAFMDDETLQPVSRIQRPVLLALAVRIGRTRLIDNTVLLTHH
jgi:pantoate--beta-alanine ligase